MAIDTSFLDSDSDKIKGARAALLAMAQEVNNLLDGKTGMPYAAGYRDKKIEIITGTLRQRAADRTKWDFIDDADHHPIGVSGTYATASGYDLTINFAKTYGKVLSFQAFPDEWLAGMKGARIGSSVGKSSAVLRMSGSLALYREIYWNGSAWVTDTLPGEYSEGAVSTSYSSGLLTVNHSYCPGLMNVVQPLHSSGIVNYWPYVRAGGNTSVGIQWLDQTFASSAAGSPSTAMRAMWQKTYNGPIHLDGTNNSSTLALENGNIWFFGIMELP